MSVFYKVEGRASIALTQPSNLMLMLSRRTSDRPILAQKPVYTTRQAPHQRCFRVCSNGGVGMLPELRLDPSMGILSVRNNSRARPPLEQIRASSDRNSETDLQGQQVK